MTKIIEKDGYTFKVKINIDIYGTEYTIEVKKKFLWFHVWATIDSYDSWLCPVKISSNPEHIVQFIQGNIDKYIEAKNSVAEINNYLENWSKNEYYIKSKMS